MIIDKSDKKAKDAFVNELLLRGYSDVKITKDPADIVAFKNGERFYFEIKKTSASSEYFGAATLTEWRAAYANPNNYFFVICHEINSSFNFIEYTPEEFEKFSTVPPFKIFFNISLNGHDKANSTRVNKSAIKLNKENLKKLDDIFMSLKDNQSNV